MPDYEKLRKNLEARGFDVTYFDTAAEALRSKPLPPECYL